MDGNGYNVLHFSCAPNAFLTKYCIQKVCFMQYKGRQARKLSKPRAAMLKQPLRAFPILLLVWLLSPVRAEQPPGLDAGSNPNGEDLKPSARGVTRLGKARYLNIGKVF